jgi:hypothetical protein
MHRYLFGVPRLFSAVHLQLACLSASIDASNQHQEGFISIRRGLQLYQAILYASLMIMMQKSEYLPRHHSRCMAAKMRRAGKRADVVIYQPLRVTDSRPVPLLKHESHADDILSTSYRSCTVGPCVLAFQDAWRYAQNFNLLEDWPIQASVSISSSSSSSTSTSSSSSTSTSSSSSSFSFFLSFPSLLALLSFLL